MELIFAKIGDPHLGREFKTGIPFERRGEYEARQWSTFLEKLGEPCDVNVNMGDLFDRPLVSYMIVLRAIEAYKTEAEANPDRLYIILAGNHDRSRQPGVVGAFDLMEAALKSIDNIVVVTTPTVIERALYLPWEWTRTAAEQMVDVAEEIDIAFCHHDLESFGGDDSHMLPAKAIQALGAKEIFCGHWHLSGDYEVDGVGVVCTGSLLPFSHAEDPDGEIYQTLTTAELAELDPEDIRNKFIRVLLEPGEDPPAVDCLSLTTKRSKSTASDETLTMEGFDWPAVLKHHLDGVPDDVRTFINDRLSI